MDLRSEDLPATLQAFDLMDNKEIFLAEQVVSNQAEIDIFTNRYAGKLIKAKTTLPVNSNSSYAKPAHRSRYSSTGVVMAIIVVLVIVLVIYGFSTGWIQEKLHMKV
ncbi:MAG: hypothetical protein JWR61_1658 [Ferruginibacter sp.]|uniref:hypothetical protein n=1 Tax=Ferruginibacter sp. TaxID=1940288 RepID=UPI00265AC7CA|nr:hypothetical protein [Ferruginibacter sp.]MDB5276703.1 hypothetical protein [Ferruginibacter sp.]